MIEKPKQACALPSYDTLAWTIICRAVVKKTEQFSRSCESSFGDQLVEEQFAGSL